MSCTGLKNVDRFVDRHGKPRHYFRLGKGPRVRLPGEPGSLEFIEAYRRAQLMQSDRLTVATDAEESWGSRIVETLAIVRPTDVDGQT